MNLCHKRLNNIGLNFEMIFKILQEENKILV